MRDNCVRSLILLLLLSGAAGCSSHMNYRQAEIATQEGRWDDAVLEYLKALDDDPENITYRAALLRAKIKASQIHFEKGQDYRKAGVLERALVEFQQAVQLDPTNQYAQAELENTHRAYLAAKQNRESATISQLKEKTKGSRPQPPVLNPKSNQPISLDFPEEVSIFELYKALGQAFGINILFDPNLKDSNISIQLKDVDAQKALEIVMRSAGHFYKVIDEQTILIAADTPQNRRTYEDQVIQTFFLSNAEVKDMLTILRSLVDAKKIATNEQLNAIIMKDSTDKVKVAEKIIASNDKSKAEVVVDVELLQINSGRLRNLGFSLSSYSIGQSLNFGTTGGTGTGTGGTGTSGSSNSTPVRLSDLQFINQGNWILTIPNFIYNFIKTNSNAQLLAKPQLRITDGEKANLVIGDRVPIPLTTFNTQNVGGQGGIVPITSFQYQDVGIRIDMEPRVHHNQEVTLKVKVEVSNLGRPITAGGQEQPTIGTRTIDSTIRLKDGETNFMAGLIRTDETASDTGIPGLSEIPVLGRLFSNKNTDNQRTDVILTLTPHIIRNAEITEEDLLPIWVGTEANFSFRGGSPRIESDVEGPFDGAEGTPEEIQDAIRRRIQRLPRGLRPGEVSGEDGGDEENAPQELQPPRGIDLVPTKPPTDIFRPPTPPADPNNPVDPGFPQVPPPTPPPNGASLPSSRGTQSVAFAANTLSAPGAIHLRLAPRQLVVAPGERFEVRVEVSALAAVSHLPFSLAFDPAVLAVEKIDAGDFLGTPGGGNAEVLSDASHPGEVVIGASRVGKVPGVAGEGLVARVTFRALGAGATAVAIRGAKALGPQLNSLGPVDTETAQVQVLKLAPPGKPAKPVKPGPPAREASQVQRG